MQRPGLILSLMVICTIHLSAQMEDPGHGMKSKCAKFEQTPLPAEAVSVATPKRWPDCQSSRAYDEHGKISFDEARQCAWAERLASQQGLEPYYRVGRAMAGSAMLTMMYANGDGVEKNIPLAIRFACEAGWAPGEVDGHVEHIEALSQDTVSKDRTFRFCDDTTNNFMQDYCEKYDAQLADQSRSDLLKQLTATWPELQRTAFAMLQEAEKAYSTAHAKTEVKTEGDSRRSQQIRAEQSIRNSFLAAVQSFEKGALPAHSAEEARHSEAELERAFAKSLADTEAGAGDKASRPEDLRTTQQAWRTYRDAWIIFARFHYPSVSEDSWITLLNKNRITTLLGGPCDADPDDSTCEQWDVQAPRPLP